MRNKKMIVLTPLLALLVLFQGCIYVSEEDRDRGFRQDRREPTVGEQLEDLREALDNGLLNREEYEQVRARIIEGED